MRIIAVGDIVGSAGVEFFCAHIGAVRRTYGADVVIANGENSAHSGTGVTAKLAAQLLGAGADVVTTGNHAFRSRDYRETFESVPGLIRPLNFSSGVAGSGIYVFESGHVRVGVVNLIGLSFMEPQRSYFDCLDEALAQTPADIFVVDFHAEATAEKKSLAWYADGRVAALFGTHTHVATADEQILPQGTGYISDVGMTGPYLSVLGVKAECAVTKQRLRIPVVFEVADGPCEMDMAVFDIDVKSKKCTAVQRLCVR